jgi:heme o synthase
MRDFLALAKPRIALMVVVTAALGFWLAGGRGQATLFWTLLGAGLSAGACGALNQWLEADADALMARTKNRPLPAGRVSRASAGLYGFALAAAGLGVLWAKSNGPVFGLTLATLLLYVAAYTPLKKVTPQTTWLGAAAGATPPLIGWAAATGTLPPKAWVLFAIQFLWQIPHFLAMFWIHRRDYARAGFKVMPVVDPAGGLTAIQIAVHSLSMLIASVLPSLCGMAGPRYGLAILVAGSAYMVLGMKASWTLALVDTRRLFLASLAYLPLVFGLLLWGGV